MTTLRNIDAATAILVLTAFVALLWSFMAGLVEAWKTAADVLGLGWESARDQLSRPGAKADLAGCILMAGTFTAILILL